MVCAGLVIVPVLGAGCASHNWVTATDRVDVSKNQPMFTGRRASLVLVRVDTDGLAIFRNPDSEGFVSLAPGQSVSYETEQSDDRVREKFTVESTDFNHQKAAIRVEVSRLE